MKMGRRMKVGERTLSEAQIERLAAMVESRLADLGNPLIRAPLPGEYRAWRQRLPWNHYDLAVDIDIGSTILTIRTENGYGAPLFGPTTDLRALSKLIMMHVFLAQSDDAGVAKLRKTEAACLAKIKRDRSGLTIVSVRPAPEELDRPTRFANRDIWVRVELLDDTLMPCTELISGRTQNAFGRDLKRYGQEHIARREASERLGKEGAVLEIDASAEHAIVASGRSVGEVARTMLRKRRPENGCGLPVVLWGDYACHHISVRPRHGRILLEAELPELSWRLEQEVTVNGALPATVLSALAGRPVRDLLDHPLLGGAGVIQDATELDQSRLRIHVAATTRPIAHDELGEQRDTGAASGFAPLSGTQEA